MNKIVTDMLLEILRELCKSNSNIELVIDNVPHIASIFVDIYQPTLSLFTRHARIQVWFNAEFCAVGLQQI